MRDVIISKIKEGFIEKKHDDPRYTKAAKRLIALLDSSYIPWYYVGHKLRISYNYEIESRECYDGILNNSLSALTGKHIKLVIYYRIEAQTERPIITIFAPIYENIVYIRHNHMPECETGVRYAGMPENPIFNSIEITKSIIEKFKNNGILYNSIHCSCLKEEIKIFNSEPKESRQCCSCGKNCVYIDKYGQFCTETVNGLVEPTCAIRIRTPKK